jgi:hypothetical protein
MACGSMNDRSASYSLPAPSEDTTASRYGRLLSSVMSSCRLREDDFPVAEPACGFRVIVVVASTRISLEGRSRAARPWVTASPGAFTFFGAPIPMSANTQSLLLVVVIAVAPAE